MTQWTTGANKCQGGGEGTDEIGLLAQLEINAFRQIKTMIIKSTKVRITSSTMLLVLRRGKVSNRFC